MDIIQKRFSPNISIFMLLGLVLISTGIWYVAYRADVIGTAWVNYQGMSVEDY
ncbi:MAG: hypothetical protein NUV47_00200 [Patescibacteria group bacterium]|nr:hypothetical protein [Patescibacteria group bacterium]